MINVKQVQMFKTQGGIKSIPESNNRICILYAEGDTS